MSNHKYKILHQSGKYPLVARDWFVLYHKSTPEKAFAFAETRLFLATVRNSQPMKGFIIKRVDKWVKLIRDG